MPSIIYAINIIFLKKRIFTNILNQSKITLFAISSETCINRNRYDSSLNELIGLPLAQYLRHESKILSRLSLSWLEEAELVVRLLRTMNSDCNATFEWCLVHMQPKDESHHCSMICKQFLIQIRLDQLLPICILCSFIQ